MQGRGDAKESSGEGASERNWPYQLGHVFVPSFVYSFIHSFSKHLLSTFPVPGSYDMENEI